MHSWACGHILVCSPNFDGGLTYSLVINANLINRALFNNRSGLFFSFITEGIFVPLCTFLS